jgi:hypothetical protein
MFNFGFCWFGLWFFMFWWFGFSLFHLVWCYMCCFCMNVWEYFDGYVRVFLGFVTLNEIVTFGIWNIWFLHLGCWYWCKDLSFGSHSWSWFCNFCLLVLWYFRLDVYIHDYLVKRDLKASAQAFQAEGKVSSDPVGEWPRSKEVQFFVSVLFILVILIWMLFVLVICDCSYWCPGRIFVWVVVGFLGHIYC